MRLAPGDSRMPAFRRALDRSPPDRPAGDIVVSNCNDAGSGSLRAALGNAVSGDTIDLTGLACSTITLTTGSLIVGVDNLTLNGPGVFDLAIDGNYNDQVLTHLGNGVLTIHDLAITRGAKYTSDGADARGGCIYSNGLVDLEDTAVTYCGVEAGANTGGPGNALCGAIYALDVVLLNNSVIAHNAAIADTGYAAGGGVYTPAHANTHGIVVNGVATDYSTISGNVAVSAENTSYGGAVFTRGVLSIYASTVSGNTADAVGGLDVTGQYAVADSLILNSTIANNTASRSYFGSGIYTGTAMMIANSTVTGNTEANGPDAPYGAGLIVGAGVTVELQSTIVSGNLLDTGSTTSPSDIGGGAGAMLTGANNLIGATSLDTPADTIETTLPRLGPLTNHGGPTLTIAPLTGSPAINTGNNNAYDLKYDQRTVGYPRVVGANADIGAFETDTLFVNGFD
ncbi:MAG: choice-of-anchor Q domain-containing protein [Rhodanobacteraceae bacterium]